MFKPLTMLHTTNLQIWVFLTNFRGLGLLFCASWQISSEKNMSKALLVSILKPIYTIFSAFNCVFQISFFFFVFLEKFTEPWKTGSLALIMNLYINIPYKNNTKQTKPLL